MTGDLPAGKWTPALIGAWWPAPSTGLRAAAQQWGGQATTEELAAKDLRRRRNQMSRNEGVTAEDYFTRLQTQEKLHLDLAEKYTTKHAAAGSAADAIDSLRSGLREIAAEYNHRIEEVENRPDKTGASVAKVIEIQRLIAEAQGFSLHKSTAAVASIMDATQRILTAEGIALSPQEFLKDQGISADRPPPPDPQQAAQNGMDELGEQGQAGTGPGHGPASGSNAGSGADELGNQGAAGSGPGAAGADLPGSAGPGPGDRVPSGVGQMPGLPSAVDARLPGGGGGLSPAAGLGGPGLSPESLGQSFSQGMVAGQPAAAGAQSLSSGTIHAVESASGPPPAQAPPVSIQSAPTVAGSVGHFVEAVADPGGSAGAGHAVEPVPVASSSAVAPAVMAGPVAAPPPLAAPMAPAAPAGPLPAYGSDLRPPVVAPPIGPGVSAAPVAGAPVAPSSPTAPAAGSPLVSPVDRAATAGAPGQPASGAAVAGAATASAAAGAAAGDLGRRAAEQQRLQRMVGAVARQEPALSWAAGLRDDGTTVLVTDVASGWIPPHVRLPSGVTLLEPGVRRRNVSAADLLGAVVVAAAHQPYGYVSAPGPDDPKLTGERARHGLAVEELGPTLVDAVRRRDGLPRLVQTLAMAAVRNSGVLDAEIEQLREICAQYQGRVLQAYPERDPGDIAAWMLLAAVAALIDGHDAITHYHLAWCEAVSAVRR